MNVGIIVYSHTGNTRQFADRIAEALEQKGHVVSLTQLQTDAPVKPGQAQLEGTFALTNTPDCTDYDAIVVGGPVWGGGPSPVIVEGIGALQSIAGKRAVPFCTMGFPFRNLGGTQSLRRLGEYLRAQGADVQEGHVVCRLFHNAAKDMLSAAEAIASSL